LELWDLLALLGMPEGWSPLAFERVFREIRKDGMPNERLEWLSGMFRPSEAAYGLMSREDAERCTGLGRIKARKVLEAFRDTATTPRRQMSSDERYAAALLIRRSTPVRALVSRHTRELLRRYYKAGKLSTPIATRQVEDRFIALSFDEQRLYRRVEDYISETYNNAAPDVRNAVGDYLSSAFGLPSTPFARRSNIGRPASAVDIADAVEGGEEVDAETVSDAERRASRPRKSIRS
jgi:hypothetical protein